MSNTSQTRLGVLISGRGSNMQSIVAACAAGELPARVVIVVANRSDAAGIEWARERGIATAVLPHKDYPGREGHDRAVVERLRAAGVEWVCLAGYMRLLSQVFIDAYPDRILNIHPALLPAFPGLHAQEQAWQWGVKLSGCTVHLVDLKLDHGPIVVQRVVSTEGAKSAEELAQWILVEEHRAYPEALRQLLTRSWRIEGRRLLFNSLDSSCDSQKPAIIRNDY